MSEVSGQGLEEPSLTFVLFGFTNEGSGGFAKRNQTKNVHFPFRVPKAKFVNDGPTTNL
jgi:hypothetical protein